MSAFFSEGGEEAAMYRWYLSRDVSADGLVAALIGVNPSTAGVEANDQTIRKDLGFAAIHGWRRIIKVNKCAYRAKDVRDLAKAVDPVGPENDAWLVRAFNEADVLVPCWGPLAKLPKYLRRRWLEVDRLMRRSGKPVMALGVCGDGQPRHTLMLAYSTPIAPWSPRP